MDTNRVEVWLAGPEAAAAADPARFDAADRARAGRLAASRKRAEWLASRALRQRAAPPPGSPTSLSHAAGHAAFGAGPPGWRVGVDLEATRPRDVRRLARFAFSPAEAEALAALDDAGAAERFYLLWTLKEACAKALGLPLLAALRDCRFMPDGGRWAGSLPCDQAWAAAAWRPRPALVLSVVAFGPAAPEAGWQCLEWPGETRTWPQRLVAAPSGGGG